MSNRTKPSCPSSLVRRTRMNYACLKVAAEETARATEKAWADFMDGYPKANPLDDDFGEHYAHTTEYKTFRALTQQTEYLQRVAEEFNALFGRNE